MKDKEIPAYDHVSWIPGLLDWLPDADWYMHLLDGRGQQTCSH